jgi:putative nucleotidyltransferase with HDIG domain
VIAALYSAGSKLPALLIQIKRRSMSAVEPGCKIGRSGARARKQEPLPLPGASRGLEFSGHMPLGAREQRRHEAFAVQAAGAHIESCPYHGARKIMTTKQSKEFSFIEGLTSELSSRQLVFPTSLKATMKIRHVLNEPDVSIDKIARVIAMEMVLSAQVLRLSNSAAFSRGGKPTADLRTAISRLGFSMVRNLAIAVGMKQMAQRTERGAMPIVDGLWTRSIRVAALSYGIARQRSHLNPESAMLAGLLHDIGKFYILYRARDYADIFVDEAALWDVVDRWHADIGDAILQSWDIPEEISHAVRDHRDLNRSHIGPVDLTDVVTAADFLDGRFYSGTMKDFDWSAPPQALVRLGLDLESSESLMVEARQELAQIFQALN